MMHGGSCGLRFRKQPQPNDYGWDALVNSSSPWPHLERNVCRGDNGGAVQVSIDGDPNGVHANHGLSSGVRRCGCKFVSRCLTPLGQQKRILFLFFLLGVSTKTNLSPGIFFVGHFGVLYSQLSLYAWLMGEKSTCEMWHGHVRRMTYPSICKTCILEACH